MRARRSNSLTGIRLDSYAMHPGLIDAALQLCLVAIGGEAGRVLPRALYLPLGADRILINPGPHRNLVARAHVRKAADETVLVADIWVDAPSGEWAMIVEGMRFGRAESFSLSPAQAAEDLYRVEWAPISALAAQDADASGTWLIFADAGGAAVGLAQRTSGKPGDGWRLRRAEFVTVGIRRMNSLSIRLRQRASAGCSRMAVGARQIACAR